MKVKEEWRTDVLPVEVQDKLIKRLRKVQGQVGGLIKMIKEQRDCTDILIQFSASKRAMEEAAMLVLKNQFSRCVQEVIERQGSPEDVTEGLLKSVRQII